MKRIVVGITGGIGSGKSVVSRICRLKGFHVYDCDSKAKELMNVSELLKSELKTKIGDEVITADGSIDRRLLAQRIFGDDDLRAWLNIRVHEMVRADIVRWCESSDNRLLFIESAILHTSHLDEFVDEIWLVEAPEAVRLQRVMLRNAFSEEEVLARMKSQSDEFEALSVSKTVSIFNSGKESLLSQINHLLNQMSNKKLTKITI